MTAPILRFVHEKVENGIGVHNCASDEELLEDPEYWTSPFLSLLDRFDLAQRYETIPVANCETSTGPWLYPVGLCSLTYKDWWGPERGGVTERSFFERIPGPTLDLLRRGDGVLLIDHSCEGGGGAAGWLRESLNDKIAEFDLEPQRIVFMTQNRSADAQNRNKAAYRVFAYHQALARCSLDYADIARLHREPVSSKRPYRYLCLNRRPTPHRLAIALHLFKTGAISKGLISFSAPGQKWFFPKSVARACGNTRLSRDLMEEYDAFCRRLPMSLDRTDMENGLFAGADSVNPPLYEQTYFSIVTESNFTNPPTLRITEKTWKAVVNRHPFILAGPAGALAEMRNLGFRTFAPLIDESYDNAADPAERMALILTEITRLCDMSEADIHDWHGALQPTLEHNARHFQEIGKPYFESVVTQFADFVSK